MTDSQITDKSTITRPDKGTQSAKDYFQGASQNNGLLYFIVHSILTIDYVQSTAKRALDDMDAIDTGNKISDPSPEWGEIGSRFLELKKFNRVLFQAFFVRCIDNFEIYLVDILREVLCKKPEILASSEKSISLEYILQFQTIESLQKDVIESKVNALSYKGFLDVNQWYADKGIPLIVSTENMQKIIELIATRNVIVHNRGKIDDKYIRTVPNSPFILGDIRKLNSDDLFSAQAILDSIVASTDTAISQKFNLDVIDFERLN